ncbi:MAG: non-ribosomal peptide synthase/polyketide synthase, partial [Gemmatimonadota bacterium]
GEVEAALRAHPAVGDAVVVARGAGAEGARLVAYHVPAEGAARPTAAELRDHLRGRLPDYMVPSAFVALDAFPLTPSGKTDRRALPDPGAGAVAVAEHAPLSTPVQEILAGIWAEVLGAGQVGTQDDFFALGGHSLLGVRVVSRVRQALGVELPLRAQFEDPTLARLAGRIEALRSAAGGTAPPVGRISREGPLPLSFAQQRLWFIDRLEPGSAAYNMPVALRLRGRFDPSLLERGLTEVARRHETLRTVFATDGAEPVQVVRDPAPVVVPVADLRGLGAESREREVLRLASGEAARPFDLAAGPLFRVAAARLDEAEWALFLTMHHIVSDGWSAGVLLRELSELYEALATGREAVLPPLAVQYADFAAWQRGWLVGEALETRLGWWRDRLAGSPLLLELPTDLPRPPVLDPRGASVRVDLPPDVSRELRALARREGATAFMALLAAWQLLLARYAGQDDVSVGVPIAGRTRLETEPLIGFFVNTLVLRTDLSGAPGFAGLLARVRETTLGAYQHQDLPFERLVEALAPERSLAHTPLFQAMFVLQNQERRELRMGDAVLEPVPVEVPAAKYDLVLDLADDGHGFAGSITFRTALWERATVERMAGHFARLVAAAAGDPARPAAGIPLATDAERARVVEEWGATRHGHPAGACIHDLFAAQARRTPGAVAVVHRGEPLTYAELDRASSRLAHALRRRGVGPESRVGVHLRRTPDALAALLAVLKAGGAYVPLDPELPAERVAFMLRAAEARVVVTESALALRLGDGVDVLALDAEAAALAREPEDAPETGVTPDNLSYLIFTSGSSGEPKGVAIQHRGAVVFLHFMREVVPPEEWASVLGSTSLGFDVSVAEVFGTLCWGGKLVLVDNVLDLPSVAGQEVRLVVAVPSAVAELLHGGAVPESVRAFNLAGEALTAELARALYGLGHVRAVRNLYGPTEATTYATWSPVPRGSGRVGIGRPVAGSRAYVLDPWLNPQPVGVPGELYLAGEGLARGYAGRPELTAERFLPDPFGEPGSRMYRVMDRARWRPDAELEYLGRTDFQVKVRGFRIEPGEIEATLCRHGRVREAVVAARDDAPGGPRLVAYVVPEDGVEPTPAELRAHLAAWLPDYMVPAAFVPLERLPLGVSGKVDRRALPAPHWGAEAAYAAPRTPVESALAEAFAAVLQRERVGIHDGFFELGGHSLLATRVTSRLHRELGVEVPLRALFEAPTVAALAARVEAALDAARPSAERIPRRTGDGPWPLSFAQQRLWFIHRLDPASSAYNMPFALWLRGAPDVPALRAALAEVARRHEALRTVVVEEAGEAGQAVLPPAPVPFPVLDLSGLPREARRPEALSRIAGEGRRPFDLARGPLLRVLLVRLAPEEWALCFTLHHIVGDGWSMGVLVREVSALYAAYSRGEESPLPEPGLQYADFAVWQRRWLAGSRMEEQLRYWRGRLDGAPRVLELPTDHPRRSALGATEVGRPFEISARTTRALRELGRREGATLFMTLLAAWQALLGRYTGQDDVVVGTVVANRTRAELEGLVGFFVNALVLREDLSGDPGFGELLGRVRETTLGAFTHQDLPFERLVEELAPERSLVQNPLFQVMFALDNEDLGVLALGDLEVEMLGRAEAGAKFDLGVMLREEGERVLGRIDYRTDLFDGSTAQRMADHFLVLLDAVAAGPCPRLSEVSLLGGAERGRVLEEWNATGAGYVGGELVHDRFARRARRTPDAVAVRAGGRTLTYGELDRGANRLAQHLRALGVGPESRVGICLERGPELVTAVLGVLKAGGAYVPLDPSYPARRLAFMVEDAAPGVLLTRQRLLEHLPPHGARVVCTDRDAAEIERRSDAAPAGGPCPENLAYVIYTSGSTGTPKGVAVVHRGLGNYVAWASEAYAGGGGGAPVHSPLSFDLTVTSLLVPLVLGERVVLTEEGDGVEGLARVLREEPGFTLVKLTPAHLALLAEQLSEAEAAAAARTLVVGGESLPAELAAYWRRVAPGTEVVNEYGPTETVVGCSVYRVPGGVRGGGSAGVPIGRPIAGTRLYVLGAGMQPQPVGVPGELYVGGAGVARGYLGRPALTAERFVPDALSGRPGERLYRTGDRVRWLASGELEFLGRTDAQVKIRGFRIEPGEVEAALAAHPGVSEAAVVVREAPSGDSGDRRLVAYVVAGREAGGAGESEFQAEHVQEWRTVFGDSYSRGGADPGPDPAFNVAGWNSSYTGEPIPAGEMREWVEDTAARLRALRPRRVLEIGCGTGLLLFRLAPECEEYWGADLSAAALSYLRAQLSRPGRELPGVRLLERTADDFGGIPGGHFDLVVVNSVAQYFPGVEYLLRVIDGAVGALAPGGTLWVGDVRSLPLLEAFHASVELAQADDDVPAPALRDRVRRRVARDRELLVDPDLFRALPHRLPRISGVEMRLKHGRHANEMLRFRYDVLLRVESEAPRPAHAWRRWDEVGSLEAVRRVLEEEAPGALAVARVPNPRVAGALAVLEALSADAEAPGAAGLRALASEREARGPDPEAFRELAEACGYRATARAAAEGGHGEYDVLLVRDGVDAALVEETVSPLPWSAYASDPLASRRGHRLLPELRAWLGERLPEHMVPGALVMLDALPLTPNGKVDRRALPAPEAAPDGAYRAPRTAVEEVLGAVWAEVLGVERVGVDEVFFELGGHSLLATRVVARIRERLGVEVPLRAIFDSPTVAALAVHVEEVLSAGAVGAPPIRRVPRDGGEAVPLSFAQQRLWLVDRLEPGSAAYNMPDALRLRGRLDPEALRAGLDVLARRHEALRTTFAERDGGPVQVVHPPARVPLPAVDLGGLSAAAREREVGRLVQAEALRPFDLARGPLLRTTLLRLDRDDHVLCFTLHHVVGDGWSMDVLVREVSAAYAALVRGEEPRLPELPVQYADYALWQREWLGGGVLEEQIGYWRRRLAGAPPLLEIPTDHPRAVDGSPRAGRSRLVLSAAASDGLRALSRREGTTLFMTLLAGWQVLLGRYAGQDDVVVGTPVAGRPRTELEGLIGFFVNMLALRTGLAGAPTWRELLARVRETALGAYAHQDLPFERLVDELAPGRSLAHSPVFQATFGLERAAARDRLPSFEGLAVELLDAAELAAQFDLDLTMVDGGGPLAGVVAFRAALFDPETVERMVGHLEVLLEAMAAEPARRVAETPLLRPAERAEVLAAGRGAARGYPRDLPVHELIAARAAAWPEAPAAAAGPRVVSYGELQARAAALAARLRARGVGPEVPVAVVLDRSVELAVALLAVLQAGGAFVPADPAYPAERLGYLLEDSRARVVLTRGALAGSLPPGAAEVLCVDTEAGAAEELPPPGVGAGALAYLCYTSGSTGRPKAAMVSHRSLVCYAEAMRRRMELVPGDRVLQFASPAFDVMIEEVFPAWLSGACVVFPGAELLASPRELLHALEAERVSVVELPTAFWHEWVRQTAEGEARLPGCLRLVLVGGERVLPERLAQWAETGLPLLHVFGLTETTVTTATLRLPAGDRGARWPNLPVGVPLDDAEALVLDAEREPVPAGVAGELYVGGEAVARGYWARPELTAERYVPHPFPPEPGARLYRTGDRVRRLADGNLEFLGRMDAQVKIRGFRVEPAEIEVVLAEHPAVAGAAVVVREDAPGDRRLVGYVAAAGGVSAAELRAHLAARLPEYMLPAAFVALERLPLTSNGKLDRRALPAPEWGGGAEYRAPRTPVEEVLAGIWAELLGTARVGTGESFFELGGHSLLATQVVSRARKAFGIELPLRTLFEAPTVAGLAERVEELRRSGAGPEPVPLERVPRGGPLPLSFAQQRLWLVDRLEPGSAAYNMPFALRLRGELDVAALRASLGALVRRHETLRTLFGEHGGEPVQVVHPAAPAALPVVDLRGGGDAGREAERLAEEEALRPFDLARGPLLRGTLLRLDGGDHVLLLTLHHIVSDGWSTDVLVREVCALYAALSRGELPELPELPVQYADYALWQRKRLDARGQEAQVAFWREQLAGAPPLLEIPTDRPRGAGQSPRAGVHGVVLPAGLAHALRALSRREGTTLFMTLLAGWQALLARYAGQDDVVVGSPVAGRSRTELEGLIGFFVNMLALRADLSGEPGAAELLGRARERVLAAYAHQELPFERLVEELATARSLVHAPIFQVVFSLERPAGGGALPALGDVRAEPFEAGARLTKFDLYLSLADDGEGLRGALTYRAALFEAETAERLAGHLETVLRAMAADPRRPLAEVPLLGEAERAQLLGAWNATDAEVPEGCVHERFELQAARTPGAAAVLSGGETITYADLERRANRLAHHLRALGAGADRRVGIFLERGADAVVAVLAVLKAGAAYVALDPSYPDERIRFMLEDAGACAAVSRAPLAGRLGGFAGPVVRLDADAGAVSLRPDAAPRGGAGPRSLAYVVYTSGSTGTPKGVLLEHGGLAGYLAWFDREVLGAEGFALPLVSSLAFDAHVRQLFPPLLRGEAVWVLPEDTVRDPAALLEALCSRDRVSFGGVPSLWSAVLDRVRSGEGPRPAGLGAVLLGGEALPEELAERTFAAFPGVALWNHYGPTEATVNTTAARVRPGEPVRIGRPIANVRVHLLDGHGNPVPVGVPGELHVGGGGVARGYLGRPELTAERFVPDPFSADAGARMYRSGDRARWASTGELEYLGRVDGQVKVRGFRVEPGEVEAALTRYPGVREAVVVPRGEVLVAYVVAEEGAGAPPPELRAHLRERLPEHMVPAAFVALDRLPLNANGKVDRGALPAAEAVHAPAKAAPRTATEELLCAVWEEVTGTAEVGTGDDFFALGGHSLLATQVVSRVRRLFGVEVPLRALFEAPTVAGLAERVESLVRADAPDAAPPLARVSRGRPLPLSFAQQRLWVVDRLDPGSPAYNLPYVLRLRGALDPAVLQRSLDALVLRHETLRTVFAEEDGLPVQVVRDGARVELEAVDLRGLPGGLREGEARRLAAEEALRPFDLARGPLLRATLLRLDEREHVLCFTLHHIVSDGWSSGVLVREVGALYGALARGEEPGLPELPVQYADYAVWQRERLSSEVLEGHLAYWKARLAGVPPLLDVPTDRPRAAGRHAGAGSHGFRLPAELTRGLRELGRREGTTLFMTALAGWQALLGRYAGQDDVVVGSPVAGRSRVELEGLIGFFVNILPLRADLGGDPAWSGLLARVREEALGAYAHQELPFERLVDEVVDERSLTHEPLVQVAFSLAQASESVQPSLGDVELETVDAGEGAAKFDLYLALSAGADGEGLRGALLYRTALFEPATAARMAGHLEILLESMCADPRARLLDAPLLRAEERGAVLAAGSAAPGAPAAPRPLHLLFREQAARTPEAVALTCEGEALTYAELERRAARVAAALRRRGAGPETRVALCAERSAGLVVGIVGILGAGAAYVPVDPAYPADRIAYLLEDSGCPVVLAGEGQRALLSGCAAEVMVLEEALAGAAGSEPPAWAEVDPESAAYLIYTSGSTGRPKGVVVTHANAARLFTATAEWFGFGADDVWTLFHSYAFDFSVWEVWGALLHGGRLVVVPHATSRSSEEFYELLVREGVTVLNQTPSAFRQLAAVEETRGASPALALRWVVFGGEALDPRTLRGWMERHGGDAPRLVNMYGITETTVHVTFRPIRRADVVAGERSPVGRAIPDLSVRVLDGRGSPVPVGVPGELYVGGAGVARGYLGRPELTAERFVPDPFGDEPGARLYRSGDRVRWSAAGELEYLGRVDAQVKVRGYRIEPGEIEAAISSHEAVRESVVVVHAEAPGDARLVAYAVPDRNRAAGVVEMLRLERDPGRARHELPNGMGIVHLNPHETEFLYREIFVEQGYLRHGVELGDGDCVFDVGANIGMFTLLAGTFGRSVRVYAFEPIPAVCEALRTNALLHGIDARVFDCGLGSSVRTETFTYYPNASVLSGRFGDGDEEREVVKSFLLHGQAQGAGGAVDEALLDELLETRLASERVTCGITTVSRVIREQGIERIDLLKVDVEKGEYDVLAGVDDEDWEKIRQVVLEVHDRDGRLEQVTSLLRRSGFEVVVDQDRALEGTGLYNVYAVRRGMERPAAPARDAGGLPWTSPARLAADVRESVRDRLPEYMVPAAVVLLEEIPLTAHGKVDRRALPAPKWGAGAAAYAAPASAVESLLCAIWAEVLGLERVGVEESFFDLGGDSILAIQVVSRARGHGLKMAPRQLFECPTVARLAEVVERVGSGPAPAEQGPVAGPAPLTPIQHWFFAQAYPARDHFNQALLLTPRHRLDPAPLDGALAALEAHHDALRLRFRCGHDGAWTQLHAPAGERPPLEVVPLAHLPEAQRAAALEREAERVQRSLDLARGPLLRAALFDLGGSGQRLLVVVHHLVVDGVSWRILLEDLESAYARLSRGEAARLPARTTSWQAWARGLAGHARSAPLTAEAAYWRAQAAREVAPLPRDVARGPNTGAQAGAVALRLSAAETAALLREVPQAYRTQIDDVLLCALARALGRWSGARRVRVGLEGHGREEERVAGADLSRTVGWFTSLYPVVLELPEGDEPGAALKAVKEQLRAVPGRGIGYGLLRYLGGPDAAAGLGAAAEPEVAFNYLGQFDGAVSGEAFFAFAPESAGASTDPGRTRAHLLEVSGAVREACLELQLGYSSGVHRRETVERLAGWVAEELRELIAHCRGAEAGGYTPSDFPLAGLGQAQLDALLGGERGVEDVYPLTPLQEGMLFHALYAPESGVYVGQFGFLLEGPLDAGALERAWQGAVDRQEALRAGFAWEGLPRPVQVVRREAVLPLWREDWRELGEAERARKLESYLEADRGRGFELGRGPLMRLGLFRVGEAAHQLVWTHHHLVLDGWSLSLLFGDVLALYGASVRGEAPRLGAARRYREYVAWLERQDRAAAERFWREALSGFDTPTPLPGVGAGRGGAGGQGSAKLALSGERTAALQERARRWGVTLNTVVQGAWGLLLGRCAGEEDVVFGATVSGRPAELAGAEETVGLFINTLPVRVRLRPEAEVGAWLGRLQGEQVEAREHGYAPLAEVQKWSGVPAGEALFESLVVYENYPVDRALEEQAGRLGGLRVRSSFAREQADGPLVLWAHAAAELHAELRYDGARVEEGAAERMAEHLQVVLEAMASGPARPLAAVSLLREGERAQLLAASRADPVEHPPACVHELFSAQAARTPALTAAAGGGGEATYDELERSSSRLGHHLRSIGVGPEVRVGICLEPGVDVVVGVLAILKAGGAYVPLDPAYPAARLAYVLADCGASVLLTHSALLELLPPFAGTVVCLDAEAQAIAARPDRPVRGGAEARNAAYVIYTSGSTGRPKGVVVEHAALANTLLGTREAFSPAAGEAMPALASYAFDIWGFEVFAPLLSGGRVRLPGRETVKDVERLVEELHDADALHAVPVLMREIVQRVQAGPGTLPRMRRVFVGGDAVPPDLIRQMRQAFPSARAWVLYGPTEAAVLAAASRLRAEASYGWQVVGRALPGAGLYVCDGGGGLLPAGVPGELWIGGDGVARGYLARPDLTAERFVPDAFGGRPGARLYRTGDRVRRRADGELEFLGRADAQVKIRGFRVEPGEVEAVLLEHPGVREAVVVAREEAPGRKRLVAYVVPEEGCDAGALRAYLAGRLPEHAVPGAFVALERVPLNANGKVDRRALPAPEQPGGVHMAPRTPAEAALSEVWAEVLGVERVGVEDGFFDLGGDSILSIQVVSRARRRGMRLTPRQVFERQTIARLAEVVEWEARESAPADQGPVSGPAPLTPVQHRFFAQAYPARDHFNQALLLTPRHRLDPAPLDGALAALEAHHDA